MEFSLKNSALIEESNIEDENIFKESMCVFKKRFIDSMEDDLNTAGAISVLFDMSRYINTNLIEKNRMSRRMVSLANSLFCELSDILGLLYNNKKLKSDSSIEDLIKQRQIARENKDWKTADEIREQLTQMGIVLEDTSNGVRYKVDR
jgi:cysteinyl-tRNA synthetase